MGGRSGVVMQEKSKAIPFLDAAPNLDGTMPGDKGFDPLLLSNTVPLKWAREAELKHARVCMLGIVGYVSVDLGFRVPYAPEVGSLAAHDATIEKGTMFGLLGGSADLQEREISNGRLAMMAFSGILTQDVITGGKGFPYTFNGARDFIPPLAEANPIDAFGF